MTKADQPKITKKQRALGQIKRAHTPETPSMTELPPPETSRWVASRKAAVVAAVSGGMITLEEACHRYQLSGEEFSAWRRAFENFGIRGLHAGYVQQSRGARPSQPAESSPTAARSCSGLATTLVASKT